MLVDLAGWDTGGGDGAAGGGDVDGVRTALMETDSTDCAIYSSLATVVIVLMGCHDSQHYTPTSYQNWTLLDRPHSLFDAAV